MYHPYADGKYSVAPGLSPLGKDFGHGEMDQKYFQIDETYPFYREMKFGRVGGPVCFATHDLDWQTRDHIRDWIHNKVHEEYPDFQELPETLDGTCMALPEDVAILKYDDDHDWLAYGCIFFPSGWCIGEKIGKSYREVHEEIPGMKLDRAEGFVKNIMSKGPFVRFVWSPMFENTLNSHPSIEKKPFDPDNPQLFMKVERQVTQPFPEKKAMLFLIRSYVLMPEEIQIKPLISALESMTKEQRRYKGIDECYDPLLEYLSSLEEKDGSS